LFLALHVLDTFNKIKSRFGDNFGRMMYMM